MEKLAPLAQLWYNSTFHTALGCSPFEALYGHEAELGTVVPEQIDEHIPVVDMI